MTFPILRASRIALGLLLFVFTAAFSRSGFFVAGAATSIDSRVRVGNTAPVVSAVVVNNGNPITLTANATTTITASFTVTDDNGCPDVFMNGGVTSTLFRFGAGTSCTANTLSCYIVATSTSHNCVAGSTTTSANATATFQLYYFADATDASSSYPTEHWEGFVLARDASSTTGSATSSAVELNTLLALHLPSSSLSYGTLSAGVDTGAANQTVQTKNAGNSSSSLQVSAQATLVSGSNSIPTSSQHYATTTFTYGGIEQQLQSTAQTVSGFVVSRPVLEQWRETTPLPVALEFFPSPAYRGYLYQIGGSDSGGISTTSVRFAPINATGSIGAWTETTPLPSTNRYHKAAVYNDYLYISGGAPATATRTVRFAPINATGSLGAWTNTTQVPVVLQRHASVAYNSYLYVIGGADSSGNETSTVRFAPINATGSIGSWADTAPLLDTSRDHSAFVYNGFLYVAGGINISDVYTSTVQYALINATGSLGTWTRATSLPTPVKSGGAIIDSGIMYHFGGLLDDFGDITSSVVFAPVSSGGVPSPWSATAPFLNGVARAWFGDGNSAYNGHFYVVSGELSGSALTSTVLFTPLATRDTYWGLSVPSGQPAGTYSGTTLFTAVFQP